MNSSDELYEALLYPDTGLPLVNIGCGEDNEIRELAAIVALVVGYEGKTVWDRSKPDGTLQKLLDVTHLQKKGWSARIGLEEGVQNAYGDYVDKIGRLG